MKKILIWVLALVFMVCGLGMSEGLTFEADEAEATEAEATEAPAEGRLAGISIGLDPGHQAHSNREQEPVAPDSSETKKKVSSGTAGCKTGVSEYVLNLDVAFQIRDALEALGCTVYMTRETHDVDISNIERAQMMNEYGVDLMLRIHADGSENTSKNGTATYCSKSYGQYEESARAAQLLVDAMCEQTGAKNNGVHINDNYTGQNWATVPCVMIEMGYMSNSEEDVKLNDPEYQKLMVQGIVNGICSFVGR